MRECVEVGMILILNFKVAENFGDEQARLTVELFEPTCLLTMQATVRQPRKLLIHSGERLRSAPVAESILVILEILENNLENNVSHNCGSQF